MSYRVQFSLQDSLDWPLDDQFAVNNGDEKESARKTITAHFRVHRLEQPSVGRYETRKCIIRVRASARQTKQAN